MSELTRRAELGEEVTITRRGKPVARLGSAQVPRRRLTSRGEHREKYGKFPGSIVEELIALREDVRF